LFHDVHEKQQQVRYEILVWDWHGNNGWDWEGNGNKPRWIWERDREWQWTVGNGTDWDWKRHSPLSSGSLLYTQWYYINWQGYLQLAQNALKFTYLNVKFKKSFWRQCSRPHSGYRLHPLPKLHL